MKHKLHISFILLLALCINAIAQKTNGSCATLAPTANYDSVFNQQVVSYLNQNSTLNKTNAAVQIPVIIHIIHGGEAVGILPNLTQAQINSQITVLNDDYAGIGFNAANYPNNAFVNYATNTQVLVNSKDGMGRIGIVNTDISFCLALKDSVGNVLVEPGIDRIKWNNISASADPTLPANYAGFINLLNNTIKPATIWNPSKYLNIWVSDVNSSIGILGHSTFPPFTPLTGIPSVASSTTDGIWCYVKAFGSQNIFSTGNYFAGAEFGRTATHEIAHYFGIRHLTGDSTCSSDFCVDTPPQQFLSSGQTPTYPHAVNDCTLSVPPTGPNGIMFMNFADYSSDAAMYMFTNDQKKRMQTALSSSAYRKLLGTHGLCSIVAPTLTANFSISATSICVGQSVNITDLSTSTGTILNWNYTSAGSVPIAATIPNPAFTFNTAGIYTITLVINGSGLSSVISNTLQVNAKPIINASNIPALAICAGKTATINLSGAQSYTTFPGNIIAPNFTVNPTATTPYSITGTSPFGCVGFATDTIKVNQPPVINSVVNSNTVCLGSAITFTNSGASSFTLFPTNFTGSVINATVTVLGTTNFTIAGTNTLGCIGSRVIAITAFSLPSVSITPSNTTICAGQAIALMASGANTYTWNNSNTNSTITDLPTAATTSYSVIGTSTQGCKKSANAIVNVTAKPTVSIASPSTNVCFGYTMAINASGATNYQWFNNATSPSTTVQPFFNTTYSVVGINGVGCADTAFLPITVLPLPTVAATASKLVLCNGGTITLNASGSATTYYWLPLAAFGATQTLAINATTTFTAYGQGSNGCAFFDTVLVKVTQGTAAIPITTPSVICIGDSAQLSVQNGYVPVWVNNPTPNTIIVKPTTATNFTVNATDNNGCIGDVVFFVDIDKECGLTVYTSFTPNGDGVNDFWLIDNIDKYPNNEVYIFNRWGNKIYHTSQYNNVTNYWDGKHKNKPVDAGTYFYTILTKDGKLIKKGWIEITN